MADRNRLEKDESRLRRVRSGAVDSWWPETTATSMFTSHQNKSTTNRSKKSWSITVDRRVINYVRPATLRRPSYRCGQRARPSTTRSTYRGEISGPASRVKYSYFGLGVTRISLFPGTGRRRHPCQKPCSSIRLSVSVELPTCDRQTQIQAQPIASTALS